MSVRRFLIAYFGVVVLLGAAGAATVIKQRLVPTPVATVALAEPAATQIAAAVAPLPPAPAATLVVPPLPPHHVAPQHARAHSNKPNNNGPTVLANRPPPRRYSLPGPDMGPQYYGPGPGPYAAAWPPSGPVMTQRPMPPYPPYPYSYGYYPRPSFYGSF